VGFFSGIIDRISDTLRRRRIRNEEIRKRRALEEKKAVEKQIQEKKERDALYRVGNEFEDYVKGMYSPDRFEITHRTPTNDDTGGSFVGSMMLPDLCFRERSTGREFWVECKYRSQADEHGLIEWCTEEQLHRYKRTRFNSRSPVFVMIGIGGGPDSPNRVYCLNIDRINFTTLFYGTYCKNRIYLGNVSSLKQMYYIDSLSNT